MHNVNILNTTEMHTQKGVKTGYFVFHCNEEPSYHRKAQLTKAETRSHRRNHFISTSRTFVFELELLHDNVLIGKGFIY